MVIAVCVTVVTGGVIVEARHQDRTAGGTTGGGAMSAGESRARCCEAINVGCFDDFVAVASRLKTLVIHHKHNDILVFRLLCFLGGPGRE